METIIITANHTIRKMQKWIARIYIGGKHNDFAIAQQTIMHYADERERVSVRRLDTPKEIIKKKNKANAHTQTNSNYENRHRKKLHPCGGSNSTECHICLRSVPNWWVQAKWRYILENHIITESGREKKNTDDSCEHGRYATIKLYSNCPDRCATGERENSHLTLNNCN